MAKQKPFTVQVTPKPKELKVEAGPDPRSAALFRVTIDGELVFEVAAHGKVFVWPQDMEILGLEVTVVR